MLFDKLSLRLALFLGVFALLLAGGCARHDSPSLVEPPQAGHAATDVAAPGARGSAAAGVASTSAVEASACTGPQCPRETAILAGGCFWGMEEILRKIPGVIATDVGYTGGTSKNPRYEDVHTGATGHAEAVRVVFDPSRLSYGDLLENWFFRMHDPTTLDRQGNDVGSQYRSAIFVTSAAQRETARLVKARVQASGKWSRPIVTQIVDASTFTPAEAFHQKYLEKNPDGYTCHYLRD